MSFCYVFKYIIIGDTGVGKSCLLLRYLDKSFRNDHHLTVGVEFGTKMTRVTHHPKADDQEVKIEIWDTAGQEIFRSMIRFHYKNSAGALLVYDVTQRESFTGLKNWLEDVRENGNTGMLITLVGNKADLESNRVVSTEEGLRFAKENGLMFFEASGKYSLNVNEVFEDTARLIYEKIRRGDFDSNIESKGIGVGPSTISLLNSMPPMKSKCW